MHKANKLSDLSCAGVLGEFVERYNTFVQTNSSDSHSKNRAFGLNKEN